MRWRWRWRQQHVVALAEAAVEAMGWVLEAAGLFWPELFLCARLWRISKTSVPALPFSLFSKPDSKPDSEGKRLPRLACCSTFGL